MIAKKNGTLPKQGPICLSGIALLADQARVDLGEDVADDRAEDQEDCNHDDGDQNEDQSVLNEALAFFFRGE
jgi:hypothetical protein